MWATIASIFSGSLFQAITQGWTAYLNAKTAEAKSEAYEHLHTLQAIRDVQIAEAGYWLNGCIRLGFALPYIAWVNKIVLYDIIWLGGKGSTDDLGPHMWYIGMVVVGFYFIHWTTGTLVAALKGK